jgi:hypothetical protein
MFMYFLEKNIYDNYHYFTNFIDFLYYNKFVDYFLLFVHY